MNSIKMRIICGLMAGTVAFGGLAFPATVRADDIDDFLDDLADLDDDEIDVLLNLTDLDKDGDIDEKDVEAIETMMTLTVLDRYAEEAERQAEAEAKRQAQIAAQQAQIAAQQAQIDALKKAEQERNKVVKVNGIYVSSTDVTLTPGQTYQIVARVKPENARNQGVSYYTSDSRIANVDQSGVIVGVNPGSCVITSSANENGCSVRTYVRVNPAPAVAAQTISSDAAWMSTAVTMITTAAPGATVNLVANKPMSFDASVINALKLRPDVSLLVSYPYKGHVYAMAVPAGYNLTAKMDKTGKVSFLSLAAVKDGKILVVMTK